LISQGFISQLSAGKQWSNEAGIQGKSKIIEETKIVYGFDAGKP
jgi:hypothetical protein